MRAGLSGLVTEAAANYRASPQCQQGRHQIESDQLVFLAVDDQHVPRTIGGQHRRDPTVEPWTIGSDVSSGCIRLLNEDVIDLFDRTPVGTPVIVLKQRV